MDKLVLISKANKSSGLNCSTSGRPVRTSFCLRQYDKYNTLGIPSGICEDFDKVDFFMSRNGFALRLGPDAERSISKNHTGRTAMVPKEITDRISKSQIGTTELVAEKRPDRTWYFPFSQFS